jgi:hypothetical protein
MAEKKVSDLLQNQNKTSFFEQYVVSNAPLIMAMFANFVVIVADVRAFDVVYQLTGSWWKALSASLACAIPFILWEISWQYNHTTDGWRSASLVMAGIAFGTSIVLGVADFLQFTGQWADLLLGGVVVLTGLHTVMGFLYYYNDPDVARRRRKAQSLAMMLDQEVNAQVATQLLASGSDLLALISNLEKQYDPDDVEKVMNILQGKKQDSPSSPRANKPQKPISNNQPAVSYAANSPKPELANRENGKEKDPTNRPPQQ